MCRGDSEEDFGGKVGVKGQIFLPLRDRFNHWMKPRDRVVFPHTSFSLCLSSRGRNTPVKKFDPMLSMWKPDVFFNFLDGVLEPTGEHGVMKWQLGCFLWCQVLGNHREEPRTETSVPDKLRSQRSWPCLFYHSSPLLVFWYFVSYIVDFLTTLNWGQKNFE